MIKDSSEITGYFHCETCHSGNLAVGMTKNGLQVFCEKCVKSVIHFDFFKQKINTRAPTLEIKEGMKTRADIEKKFEEVNDTMSRLSPGQYFEVASTDGQRYILEWILGQHD